MTSDMETFYMNIAFELKYKSLSYEDEKKEGKAITHGSTISGNV